MKGKWEKHTIATRFVNGPSPFNNAASPGFPYPFYPRVADANKKNTPAHILVAGDGDEKAHLLTPHDMEEWRWDSDILTKKTG